MCTSLTYKTSANEHFLARTMDFSFFLNAKPVFIPRGAKTYLTYESGITPKYATLGTGVILGKYIFQADGLNEKGLAVAELYFAHQAYYNTEVVEGKINLAPQEFLGYLLATFANIDEVAEALPNIRLVNPPKPIPALPLHFILTDKTGRTVVIEPQTETLVITENPVGVMTNTPELDWHIKNLNNYLDLQPLAFPDKNFGEQVATAFSQGTGTQNLPGSFTPPDRFVRAAFGREYLPKATTTNEAVNNITHILSMVTVPKGVNLKPDGSSDFTQYTSILSLDENALYFDTYDNPTVYRAKMTDEMIESGTEIIWFEPEFQLQIVDLNK